MHNLCVFCELFNLGLISAPHWNSSMVRKWICSSELLIFEQIIEKIDSIKPCVKIAEPFSLPVILKKPRAYAYCLQACVFDKPVQFKTVVPRGSRLWSNFYLIRFHFFLLQFKPLNKASESNFHLAQNIKLTSNRNRICITTNFIIQRLSIYLESIQLCLSNPLHTSHWKSILDPERVQT